LQVLYCIIDTGMYSEHPDLSGAVINGCPDLPTTPCAQWDIDYQVGRLHLPQPWRPCRAARRDDRHVELPSQLRRRLAWPPPDPALLPARAPRPPQPPAALHAYLSALQGHGTHVAGTIGALRNQQGVVGVAAERARMYIYNIFGSYGSFAESQLIGAWDYCLAELDRLKATVDTRFKMVVSMSVGGDGDPAPELESYLNAKYTRGDVLFLAAAGNSGTPTVSYPAGYSAVMSVAATDANNARGSFSQYNSDVEISAPGVQTLSTVVPGDGGLSSATVMTSPPVNNDPDDDNLQNPPLAVLDGSRPGTVTAVAVDCGLAMEPCANAQGKVCLIQRGAPQPRCPRPCRDCRRAAAHTPSCWCMQIAGLSWPGRRPAGEQKRNLPPRLLRALARRRRHLLLHQGHQLHGRRGRGRPDVRPGRPAALRASDRRDTHGRVHRAGRRVRGISCQGPGGVPGGLPAGACRAQRLLRGAGRGAGGGQAPLLSPAVPASCLQARQSSQAGSDSGPFLLLSAHSQTSPQMPLQLRAHLSQTCCCCRYVPTVGLARLQGELIKGVMANAATLVTLSVPTSSPLSGYKTGTSMATPHASAVAGLVWSGYLGCSNEEIRQALRASALDLGSPGRDALYG
jgi:subtilisin family serine protease